MREPVYTVDVEPGDTPDEASVHFWEQQHKRSLSGPVVIKGDESPWLKGKMSSGASRAYLSPYAFPDTPVQTWYVFEQKQYTHSGKHIHQGGVVLFVLEGRGHTVIDGQRYDWEAGDLIILPIQPGGVEHQQFNDDPDRPCRLVAFLYQPFFMELGNYYTQTGKPGETKL